MERRLYWLGWQLILPGSGKLVWNIINHCGGVEEAWRASEKALREVPDLTAKKVDMIIAKRKKVNLEQELEYLHKHNVEFCTIEDQWYPPELKNIYDPPPVLFIRGKIKVREHRVALVGARKATAYGRTVAERLSAQLAQYDVTIVSGMARGIDTAAHRGALRAKGDTIAVLGCGVDVVYPRENRRLMEEIIETGAVISEFPLGSPPTAWHFPSRNRIISGLSKVVVVVEAAEKSGALITVDLALEQGKEVMAVPGSIYSNMSKGCHKLLKEGAKIVSEVEDIIEELGLNGLFSPHRHGGTVKLNDTERRIHQLLKKDPLPLDNVIQTLELPSQQVLAALMYLELKGMVRQMPGKIYAAVD